MDLKGLGRRIAQGRHNAGLTQTQLGIEIGVAATTVSKWENGRSAPGLEQVLRLSETLKMHPGAFLVNPHSSTTPLTFRGRLFHEENMYTRVKNFAVDENLEETFLALYFMRDRHKGQFRKDSRFSTERIAYIIHPLNMACQAHAMNIRDDAILAGILLHDVVEDTGIEVSELPFSDEVREIVDCVTFRQPGGQDEETAKAAYYARIAGNRKACVIKVLDRCNNVSTMAGSFDHAKLIEYIQETETYVLPLLKVLKNDYPEFSDLAYLVKYHILSVIETIKYLL